MRSVLVNAIHVAVLVASTTTVSSAMGAHLVKAAAPCPDPNLGGAAPPTLLSASAHAKLKRILAPYDAHALTLGQACAIRDAMSRAGLCPSAALDKALADLGFSPKRFAAIAASCSTASEPRPAGSSPLGRKVPRPE